MDEDDNMLYFIRVESNQDNPTPIVEQTSPGFYKSFNGVANDYEKAVNDIELILQSKASKINVDADEDILDGREFMYDGCWSSRIFLYCIDYSEITVH